MTLPPPATPPAPVPPAAGAGTGHAATDRTTTLRALVANIERVITGKPRVVELAVVALASGGHVLLDDVPGVGKTVLARALARSIDGKFARIQGAPDLLPSDVTGSSIYHQAHQSFEFVPGAIFANIVLVDEVNRTTPRTQAALLEAMEERQVSVDGTTHLLPAPHFVIATQNPLEHHGTFPLPESQLDRFTIATSVGYPTAAEEAAIVRAQVHHHPLEDLGPVVTTQDIQRVRASVRAVAASDELIEYAVRLATATRQHDDIELGASPRASIQLIHAAQALAALRGRDFVLPDDVKELAPAVLAHRLILRRVVSGTQPDRRALVGQLLRTVAVGAGA